MIQQLLIKELTSVLGTIEKPNRLWYLKEATKNNFSCRSKETGTLFFIYTNRGNLKLNPDFVSLVPEKYYKGLINYLEFRFPELKPKFAHNPPKVMLMQSGDMTKVNYSKF
jgi:hypothetical protein